MHSNRLYTLARSLTITVRGLSEVMFTTTAVVCQCKLLPVPRLWCSEPYTKTMLYSFIDVLAKARFLTCHFVSPTHYLGGNVAIVVGGKDQYTRIVFMCSNYDLRQRFCKACIIFDQA